MPNEVITLSNNGDSNYRFHRNLTKKDHMPVPLRWQTVLAYHLAGKKASEITQLTGYSSAMIYRILSNKDVQSMRQQMLASTQQEFEAMFSQIVDTIKDALSNDDMQVRLTATNQWLKANGKFAPSKVDQGVHITAEDVVLNLLNNNTVSQVE